MKFLLTQRQAVVLGMWRKGFTQKQIAQELRCSEPNVCQCLMRIERKYPELRLKNRMVNRVLYNNETEEVEKPE